MIRLIVLMIAVASLNVVFNATATEAVNLDGMKLMGAKATGTCGTANVVVSAIGPGHINFDGRVEITSGASKLIMSSDEDPLFLQDYNYVSCLKTPKGQLLLVKASCGGTVCIPDDFRVIDPKTAKVISKGTPDEGCDTACAEKALGMRMPDTLRPTYAD